MCAVIKCCAVLGRAGFPRDALMADPESITYEALGLVKGVQQTFFGTEVGSSWV